MAGVGANVAQGTVLKGKCNTFGTCTSSVPITWWLAIGNYI